MGASTTYPAKRYVSVIETIVVITIARGHRSARK